MPFQRMYKATALRPRRVRCEYCGAEYIGFVRTEAISRFQYGTMGKDEAEQRLNEQIASGKAHWEPYPCRCPSCGKFSSDTVGLVRLTWGVLGIILLGVTIAISVMGQLWVAYFYVFSSYPIRKLVRFYRQKTTTIR